MLWTEGGPDYTDPGYLNDWCMWGGTFSDVLRNWCRSVTAWNLALDEHGEPNIVSLRQRGDYRLTDERDHPSGPYWAFAHYSRVIRRGARRFDSQNSVIGLEPVALENPDGQKVLIVTHPGPTSTIALRLSDTVASVPFKATSVTTLVWR
jgi:glucosylceramidase